MAPRWINYTEPVEAQDGVYYVCRTGTLHSSRDCHHLERAKHYSILTDPSRTVASQVIRNKHTGITTDDGLITVTGGCCIYCAAAKPLATV